MSDANGKQPEVKKSAPADATPAAVKKSKYKVRSRLDHDGKTYLPGESVDLTDTEAVLSRDALEA